MHERFAQKIATHLHIMKWRRGVKPDGLAQWLATRFPNLRQEDAAQIRAALPVGFNGTKK
jgi:hypothetical protein